MNFIYYLKTGKSLEVGRSKKGRFFKFIVGTKWSYLLDYNNYINWFDEQLNLSLYQFFIDDSVIQSVNDLF